jgi:MFS family permease
VAGGPLVGGAVVQGLDWHWIFWINVPIGLAAAILARARLPESRGQTRRLDIGGLTLVAAGAVALAWGLVRTTAVGWSSAQVILALCAGAILIAGFIAWERRVAEPMLPLRLLRIRAFTAANATGFMSLAAISSAAFLMSQFFQLGLGYSPLGTGLRFLPWTATPLLIAPVAGRLADRIGVRPLMAGGMAMQAGGLAWVAMDITTGATYGELVLPLIIAGIGISMSIPTTPTAALDAVPPADMGTASGVQNTLQRFGAVFGVAIVTAVFSASGHLGSAAGVISGVRPALAASAGLSLAGALAALAVGSRRRAVAAAGVVQAPALASAQEVSHR